MADATRILIEGRVQGVGYREWLRGEATRRRLSGYCRNLPDGRVDAVVIGDHAAIDQLVAACRVGPSAARVTGVGVDAIVVEPLDGFVVLR